MEQAQQEKVYMERLPLVAMQIRSALGNIYYGMQKLAPADERDEDPILDANAAMLYHGYFRLLRLAKNLESASMLNRKELLPTENTDLKVWLDEIIREAEVPFELKGVQLEMVCEERYAITAVNEPWLSQALWQLLSNALKACSAGGKVTVTLAVQKPHVLIKVKDTGCGIPADRQEMLFRWHMRPMTLDYVAGGVGLGLPLAHQIARLHGGQLLLNSREGQGTTATIALPWYGLWERWARTLRTTPAASSGYCWSWRTRCPTRHSWQSIWTNKNTLSGGGPPRHGRDAPLPAMALFAR